eukprot:TRINITY_DN3363_c1_g2_i1.p1 TRINITY_DN3363_c1_g2~~TRINITY_DN3363_c1_g2_i1.p1  ORF type:complete len:291 (+),score=60.91 TRINITY_DN3363_c1_g2_i1:58-930(+)
MMRSAVMLVMLPVVASLQSEMSCLMDVGLGAYGLIDAGLGINNAVTACGDASMKGKCAADIGQVVSGLGSASAYISMAVGDCGGEGNQCSVDVSQAISSLGKALQDAGAAEQACKQNSTALCVSDVLAAASKVALTASEVQQAKASCSAEAGKKVKDLRNFNMNCIMDVAMAAFGLVNGGLAINSAVTDCGSDGNAGACAADVGKIVAGFGSASAQISAAVGDCGGATNQCSVDVSKAVSSIGTATEEAGKAAQVCGDKTHGALCTSYILAAGSSLSLAVSDLQAASKTC